MDAFGSNATPMGGSAGRADAAICAVEAQKAEGVLHLHAFIFFQSAHQFNTLHEIGNMLRHLLITVYMVKIIYNEYSARCVSRCGKVSKGTLTCRISMACLSKRSCFEQATSRFSYMAWKVFRRRNSFEKWSLASRWRKVEKVVWHTASVHYVAYESSHPSDCWPGDWWTSAPSFLLQEGCTQNL